MQRRNLLATALLAPAAALSAARAAGPASGPAWRRFEVQTRVKLLDSPGSARLWVPLAQSAAGYQKAGAPRWEGNGRAEVVQDARYGASMLRVAWDRAASGGQQVTVTQTVATRDRGALVLAPLTEAERAFWTAPTESVPTDGIVRDAALRITAGRDSPWERLRALYDWVVDTTWRNPDTPGCGTGDVQAMLGGGAFGGKCADINGLMVALARAAGFPARDVYGIRVADSRFNLSLGRAGDITKAQHCRAEVFLDGEGWFPVDPADVRKVVLEEKFPLDSPAAQAARERLFGAWETNWVGFNGATDIELPGAGQQRPNFAFLMYPCASTVTGQPNCLDPARFRYEITSQELTA